MTRAYTKHTKQERIDRLTAQLERLRKAHDQRGNKIGRLANKIQALINKLVPPVTPNA